jgi:hypothetical protein
VRSRKGKLRARRGGADHDFKIASVVLRRVRNDDGFVLFVAVLLYAFCPDKPHVHPMSRRVRSFELAVTVRLPGGRLAQERSLECARRHTHCPPECCDEVRRCCEADTVGDLGDGLPWLLQECDPAFKPA